MKSALILTLSWVVCLATFSSCHSSREPEEKSVRTVVPVTVTSPRVGRMAEFTELMATSSFLVKAAIKSPVTGYVEKCSITPGDRVIKNQLLFQVRTQEAAALSADSLGLPSGIRGLVVLKASIDGKVASIDHPIGDYVQEGDVLCTIVVPGSLVFLLDVPFEIRDIIRPGSDCKLSLPDHTEIIASVRSILPSISAATQTQRVVLQPLVVSDIPENLMATVKIQRNVRNSAVILPKSCILNDEIMKNFWVMKMISDSVAVKIPIVRGIKGTDSIEIVSPALKLNDRILVTGNYGLGDTAVVRIIGHE